MPASSSLRCLLGNSRPSVRMLYLTTVLANYPFTLRASGFGGSGKTILVLLTSALHRSQCLRRFVQVWSSGRRQPYIHVWTLRLWHCLQFCRSHRKARALKSVWNFGGPQPLFFTGVQLLTSMCLGPWQVPSDAEDDFGDFYTHSLKWHTRWLVGATCTDNRLYDTTR